MKRLAVGLVVLVGLSWAVVSPAADLDGNGTNDVGIFRDNVGLWAIRDITRFYFGKLNDQPFPGDYTGDGITDVAIFRNSSGLWAVRDLTRVYYGTSGDEPLVGVGGGSPWRRNGSDIYYNGGNVGIGTNMPGSPLAVAGLSFTSAFSPVRVDTATGNFYYSSSSARWKKEIKKLQDDFHRILGAEPKSFVDKTSGSNEIGYLAEEFDAMGLGNLVIYDGKKRPEGLKYELISLYLVEIIKEQQEKIVALEKRLSEVEGKINRGRTTGPEI